jgi:DNA-binding CsgD family transcriptional regulator
MDVQSTGLGNRTSADRVQRHEVSHAHTHRIVAPKVTGSSPVGHPTSPRGDPAQRRTKPRRREVIECRTSAGTSAAAPTPRQLEVLGAVLATGSVKAAAFSLALQPGTVNKHLERLRGQLDVATTAQAVYVLTTRGVLIVTLAG